MEGKRLGPYRVISPLGSGGMGAVYHAEAVRSVPGLEAGTHVALKVIHAHLLETEGFFKRFLREAQIGQQVEHANVVRTYDCDATLVDGTTHHYLVMEHVEGQTLRDLLEELERVPEELCRHIGCEVAKGLTAIHAAGVVHRDLKPENVLITPDHVVKVMDLGVARLADEAIRLSQTGAFVGSLEYAAPEQLQRADGELDGRADLHALGVVLYELATGHHPYRDEDIGLLLRNVLEAQPRPAGEVNPQLSPFFEELVHTLLAKDRDARLSDAVELAGVLAEGEESAWWRARAKALRAETKRPLRRIRIPRETALYGRDDDLAKLHELYDEVKAGEGRVVLIEGEAGIGKTRLVDELVGRLGQEGEDVNFLFGSYPPGGAATASGAFSTAYREQFGEAVLESVVAGYLSTTPSLVPAFAALLRGDAAPKEAQPLTKESLQTVFVNATRGLAAERPTIVLIDDLHFAPEEGRALFSSLAMAVPEHRILLVGTAHPGGPESWTSGVGRLDHAEQLVLGRLGAKDLARLLEDAFHSERLAAQLGHQIAMKSDGNPFFTFEIIRGLREGQFITQRPDGTWVTTDVIQDIQVPSTILDMVQARLGDLSEEERELLDVAACCGFEFAPGLVGEVLGLEPIPTLRALGRVEREHRLIRSAGRQYVFDHHQVQESLYAGLHEELREAYHAAVGIALERRAGADDEDPERLAGDLCVELCEHFLEGGQAPRALRYFQAAASHLESGFLQAEGVTLVRRVLDVPGLLEGTKRFKALILENRLLHPLGRRDAQRSVLSEAQQIAETGIDADLEWPLEAGLGALAWVEGDFERAVAHHERSLVLARQTDSEDAESLLAVQLGHDFHRLGRQDEARRWYQRGLDLAPSGRPDLAASAQLGLGNVSFALSRHEEALAHTERGIELSRAAGDTYGEALAHGNLGNSLGALGRWEEGLAHQWECLRLTKTIGRRTALSTVLSNTGNALHALGRFGEALDLYERSLRVSREIGSAHGTAINLVNLGAMRLKLGDLGGARENLDATISICRKISSPYPEGYALWALGELSLEEDDVQQALALAEESLTLRRRIQHGDGIVESLLLIARVRLEAGEIDAARQALDEAIGLVREQGGGPHLAALLALRADPTCRDVAEALEVFEETGSAGEQVSIRYDLWRATGDVSQLAAAKRLLDHLVEHAPEEHRETMVRNVRLYREIVAAWVAHAAD